MSCPAPLQLSPLASVRFPPSRVESERESASVPAPSLEAHQLRLRAPMPRFHWTLMQMSDFATHDLHHPAM
jgi:hypothetical protein